MWRQSLPVLLWSMCTVRAVEFKLQSIPCFGKRLFTRLGNCKFSGTDFVPQCKREAENISRRLKDILSRDAVDLSEVRRRVQSLELEKSSFTNWEPTPHSLNVLAEISKLQNIQSRIDGWSAKKADISTLIEMAEATIETVEQESCIREAESLLSELSRDLDDFEMQSLFSGPYDGKNCVLSIQCGVGGTDAQDWTSMLYRMYSRYAEGKGFRVIVLEKSTTDVGMKSVEMRIEGENAYGIFSGEKGTHRLVRISPFNAMNKRQTSFAGVEVFPILEQFEMDNVTVLDKDLEVSTMRSSGAGGQNVNKVESAVRIKHLPSGITVRSSTQRSQSMNKAEALQRLKQKLLVVAQSQALKNLQEIRGDAVEATFGQQIRNYVLAPYKLVKDVRTGEETSQVQTVLDGDLDRFVFSYIRHISTSKS